jgi:hypothetical protein
LLVSNACHTVGTHAAGTAAAVGDGVMSLLRSCPCREGDRDDEPTAVAWFGLDITAVGAGHCSYDRQSQAHTGRGDEEALGAEAAEGLEETRDVVAGYDRPGVAHLRP